MKKTLTALLAAILVITALLSLASCSSIPAEGLWENATYRSDRSFGDGEKTFTLTVEVGEYSVVFTVNTDKATLDEALLEHNLIAGEDSQYGLTLITVNGIDAVWDTDNAYWAIYIGDDYATTGISEIAVDSGASYKFVYTKM